MLFFLNFFFVNDSCFVKFQLGGQDGQIHGWLDNSYMYILLSIVQTYTTFLMVDPNHQWELFHKQNIISSRMLNWPAVKGIHCKFCIQAGSDNEDV